MHSHLWGFRSLKSIYSSVLHRRGPDSGIQQKMATHSISNPTSFSSHMSNYHIWSHTLTVLSQSPPSSLSFSVRLSICTFTMLFLQPACLSILSLNDIFTSKKSHFLWRLYRSTTYTHTHTPSQNQLPCHLTAHIMGLYIIIIFYFCFFPYLTDFTNPYGSIYLLKAKPMSSISLCFQSLPIYWMNDGMRTYLNITLDKHKIFYNTKSI